MPWSVRYLCILYVIIGNVCAFLGYSQSWRSLHTCFEHILLWHYILGILSHSGLPWVLVDCSTQSSRTLRFVKDIFELLLAYAFCLTEFHWSSCVWKTVTLKPSLPLKILFHFSRFVDSQVTPSRICCAILWWHQED